VWLVLKSRCLEHAEGWWNCRAICLGKEEEEQLLGSYWWSQQGCQAAAGVRCVRAGVIQVSHANPHSSHFLSVVLYQPIPPLLMAAQNLELLSSQCIEM
jgi:hypothetical protein